LEANARTHRRLCHFLDGGMAPAINVKNKDSVLWMHRDTATEGIGELKSTLAVLFFSPALRLCTCPVPVLMLAKFEAGARPVLIQTKFEGSPHQTHKNGQLSGDWWSWVAVV
jgi:hypothetical protein